MKLPNSNARERSAVIALCEKLGKAHADRDADAVLDCYAPDAVVYDMAPPLGRRGADRRNLEEWFATWNGPISIESADVELIVAEEMAYLAGFNRMRGTKIDGEQVDLWFRTTMCLRKLGGRWCITHDHSSVPFHMDGSYRACIDLEPETTA
ncbi:MAG: nuclear transport factor 2 family protein [Pseudomonadota bacterium]